MKKILSLTAALLLAAARHIPEASASMHEGQWRRADFMGSELFGKTLAIFGLGRVGGLVAERAAAHNPTAEPLLLAVADDDVSPYTRRQCRMLQTHLQNLRTEKANRAVYRIVAFMGYGDYLDQCGADKSRAEILEVRRSRILCACWSVWTSCRPCCGSRSPRRAA